MDQKTKNFMVAVGIVTAAIGLVALRRRGFLEFLLLTVTSAACLTWLAVVLAK